MAKLQLSFLTLTILAACGDDAPTGPPSKITVSTVRAPKLIAFRDGLEADWKTPKASATGTYELEVHGPYVVTVVCDMGSINTYQIARTPEDKRELEVDCSVWTPEPTPDSFQVTGKMVQPGSVAFGNGMSTSSTADWEFGFETKAGEPHDLLAISDDRILIRRDLAFTSDARVEDVDVVKDGVTLEPRAFTASNTAAGELVEARVGLWTATSFIVPLYEGVPEHAKIAPAAILRETDQQTVSMSANLGDSSRYVFRYHRAGDPTEIELPDPIRKARLPIPSNEIIASWGELPAHDEVCLSAYAYRPDDRYVFHGLVLSRSYLAATGATEATLETEIPGYLLEWEIDFRWEYTIELAAVDEEPGEYRSSAVWRTVNAPPSQEQRRFEQRPRFDGRLLPRE